MPELQDSDVSASAEELTSIDLSEADFSDPAKLAVAKTALIANSTAKCCSDTEKAPLFRPHISVLKAVLNVLIPLVVAAGIFCILFFLLKQHRLAIALGVSLGVLFLYVLIRLRAIMIWCIHVYQAKAPEHVRRRCVFTPTCSQYAIESLERFGVIKGTVLTFKRLLRCHFPNGGQDPVPEKGKKR